MLATRQREKIFISHERSKAPVPTLNDLLRAYRTRLVFEIETGLPLGLSWSSEQDTHRWDAGGGFYCFAAQNDEELVPDWIGRIVGDINWPSSSERPRVAVVVDYESDQFRLYQNIFSTALAGKCRGSHGWPQGRKKI